MVPLGPITSTSLVQVADPLELTSSLDERSLDLLTDLQTDPLYQHIAAGRFDQDRLFTDDCTGEVFLPGLTNSLAFEDYTAHTGGLPTLTFPLRRRSRGNGIPDDLH